MHPLEEELTAALARCTTPEQAREQGRRAIASLRAAFEQLRSLPHEQRRSAGQELNRAKAAIERRVDARLQALAAEQPIIATHLSPTLPAPPVRIGQVHPTVAVMRRMHAFFTALGFTVADGPEIESDWYNSKWLPFQQSKTAVVPLGGIGGFSAFWGCSTTSMAISGVGVLVRVRGSDLGVL
jgi:phenylalanyl-tRNA synthetase alpha subunit